MKRKLAKAAFIIAVSLVFSFSVAKVYAQTTGIDIISMAKSKVLALMSIDTAQSTAELDNTRIQVKNDTLNYVDQYIKGLDDELKAYTDQQTADSKGKLKKTYDDIKSQLDSSRQSMIDDAKAQIKATIDSNYQQEQNTLNDDLNKEIGKKFN